jgi:hypothetical protein
MLKLKESAKALRHRPKYEIAKIVLGIITSSQTSTEHYENIQRIIISSRYGYENIQLKL